MKQTRELTSGTDLVAKEMRAEGGAEFPWHTASLESVLILLEGAARFEFRDRTHNLQAGDTFIVPAEVPHRVVGSPAFTAVHVMPRGIRFNFVL